MGDSIEQRILKLERRISQLEAESMHTRPLGPQPQIPTVNEEIVRKLVEAATVPPVDRSQRTMTDGTPETEDHREIDPATGMQKGYIVLSAEERRKGFVRPVRRTYRHLTCNTTTTMGIALAETYARDPYFYSGTFCCHCRAHFDLDQFVWEGTDEKVGS